MGSGMRAASAIFLRIKCGTVDSHATIASCKSLGIEVVELLSQILLVQSSPGFQIFIVLGRSQLVVERLSTSRRWRQSREYIGRHNEPTANLFL